MYRDRVVTSDVIGSFDRAARELAFSCVRTVDPVAEPLTPADLGKHAVIDSDLVTADSDIISAYITQARSELEESSGLSFITQTWRMTLDRFPYWDSPMWIPRGPLQSITSLQYIDVDGITQTLVEGTDFRVDKDSKPPRIVPTYGQRWPYTRFREIACVTIVAVCGFGNAGTNLPPNILQAIRMVAAYRYRFREDAELLIGGEVKAIARAAASLMAPHKVWRFG